jgi:PBP1b-binding outer membrane lipoprotein LpoB
VFSIKKLFAATMLALMCGACTGGGDGASSGPPLNAQECDAVTRKGWELQGTSLDTEMADPNFKTIYDRAVQLCVKDQDYSRKDYECLMKATTMDQFQDCHVVVHVK